MDDLAVASRHLNRDNDLRAAAVYVRAALEASLRKVCKDQGIMIRYNPNPHEVKADALWKALLRRHVEHRKKEGRRFLDTSLIPRVSAVRSAVLNRLSHTGPPALTKSDVLAAIATVRDFRSHDFPFEK